MSQAAHTCAVHEKLSFGNPFFVNKSAVTTSVVNFCGFAHISEDVSWIDV